MKSIFYIEQEKFLRLMLEQICKEQSINIYTVESVNDCFYIIEDIRPDIVVIDIQSASDNLAEFLDTISQSNLSLNLVATGSSEDWESLGEAKSFFSLFEEKPIAASGLIDRLQLAILEA